MRSIEVHLIQAASDIDAALLSGLLSPREADGLRCSACADEVGHVSGAQSEHVVFNGFGVLVDERDEPWVICYPCLEDVVEPASNEADASSRYSSLFDDEDEFERFDLLDDE